MRHKKGIQIALMGLLMLGGAGVMGATTVAPGRPIVVPPRPPVVPPVRPPVVGSVLVPGYGPGIAGNVTRGPIVPVCRTGQPCDGPYANVPVQVTTRRAQTNASGALATTVVATAITNERGNFIVSVPPGTYTLHAGSARPRIQPAIGGCSDVQVSVTGDTFALVTIGCDTGIR